MKMSIGPKGVVQLDDVRIIYRNFSGLQSKFNRAGDRNFSVIIDDQEIADQLIEMGFNVKIKPPREEGDISFMHLAVKVNFDNYPPKIYLVSDGNQRMLDSETVGCIDFIDILHVDLDINPSSWEVNGNTGISAYLRAMKIEQEVDRFDNSYR